jgi:predicted site-specific integrase-resolvase
MNGAATTKQPTSPTYVRGLVAQKTLGVSSDTLRRWSDEGRIQTIRTAGGIRLYNVASFVQENCNQELSSVEEEVQPVTKQRLCYCRVSSAGQRDDLERQVTFMRSKYPQHTIITDVGSGINWKRKGLRTILDLAHKGQVEQVVVAYRDRLCRFAFELVEWILQRSGVQLVVLNQSLDSSGQSELADDLLSIIQVFNSRVNGKRKYKELAKSNSSQEEGQGESNAFEEDNESSTQCDASSEAQL